MANIMSEWNGGPCTISGCDQCVSKSKLECPHIETMPEFCPKNDCMMKYNPRLCFRCSRITGESPHPLSF